MCLEFCLRCCCRRCHWAWFCWLKSGVEKQVPGTNVGTKVNSLQNKQPIIIQVQLEFISSPPLLGTNKNRLHNDNRKGSPFIILRKIPTKLLYLRPPEHPVIQSRTLLERFYQAISQKNQSADGSYSPCFYHRNAHPGGTLLLLPLAEISIVLREELGFTATAPSDVYIGIHKYRLAAR